MKVSFIAFLAAVCAFALACQPPPTEPPGLSEADIAAIEQGTDTFTQGILNGDFAAVANLYAEDAIFMPPNEPMVRGRAAIEAWMKNFPTATEFVLRNEEIEGCGDIAVIRGTLSMTLTPEGAPEPVRDEGKYIEIRRKQADGSWLIVRDIFNSDMPAAPPAPPKTD